MSRSRFDVCPTCGFERDLKRWLLWWTVGFALAMFLSHIVGIRVCYEWLWWACGPGPVT